MKRKSAMSAVEEGEEEVMRRNINDPEWLMRRLETLKHRLASAQLFQSIPTEVIVQMCNDFLTDRDVVAFARTQTGFARRLACGVSTPGAAAYKIKELVRIPNWKGVPGRSIGWPQEVDVYDTSLWMTTAQFHTHVHTVCFLESVDVPLAQLLLPQHLQSLVFWQLAFHKSHRPCRLDGVIWPDTLTDLRVDCLSAAPRVTASMWPGQLVRLHLGFSLHEDTTMSQIELPNTLRVLTLSDGCSDDIRTLSLPRQLEELAMGAYQKDPLTGTVWPPTLRKLTLGFGFDSKLEPGDLPSSLEELDLNYSYKHALDTGVLPRDLRILHVMRGDCVLPSHRHVAYPNQLCELHLSSGYLGNVSLPPNLRTLVLAARYDEIIPRNMAWPATLRHVLIREWYVRARNEPVLPDGVKLIYFDGTFPSADLLASLRPR